MGNLKITDLSSLSQSALDAAADFLLAVDISDTAMSASGTNVKITPKSLVGGSINDLIQTWNSGATAFTGFKLNITDTASDADSSLMDLQIGGSSKFRVKKDGTIYVNGSVFSGGGSWGSITGTLSDQTDLQSALDAKLSLSGGTLTGPITGTSQTIEQRNSTNAQRFNLYGTYTDGSNYRRCYISSTTGGLFTFGSDGLGTGGTGNDLRIVRDGTQYLYFGSSGMTFSANLILSSTLELNWDSRSNITSPAAGVLLLRNSTSYTDFARLQFGGTTSSFPSIKRNGTAINFRLADDSADAPITAGAITASDIITGLRLVVTAGDVRASGTSIQFMTSNTNERMRINSSGNVGIGATDPNVALMVRRVGTDLPAIRLEDGDVTVPFTGIVFNPNITSNTVGSWSSNSSSSGGSAFLGFTSNTAASYPLIFEGYHGSASPTKPVLNFSGYKTNGSTGSTTLASSEILAGFYNGSIAGTPVVTITANGAITSGAITTPSMHLSGTSDNIGIEYDADGVRLKAYSGSALMYVTTTGGGVRIAGSRELGWVSDANSANGGTFDTKLVRDAANTVAQRNSTNTQTNRIYQSYTDGSNYHRWKIDWSTSTCRFGTERAGTGATGNMELWQNGSAVVGFNSGGKIFFHNRDITFGYWNGGNVSLRQASAYSGILDLVDCNSHSTFLSLCLGTLYFGGTTSSQTRITRNTTTLRAQLADGSAFTNFQAKLTTETNYTAGAPTATGYLVLYDATGTAYKVPAEAL